MLAPRDNLVTSLAHIKHRLIALRKRVRSTWSTNTSSHAETNGGQETTKFKCGARDSGERWFSSESMINVLPLSEIVGEHRITLDASEEKAPKVCFPRKIVKLKTYLVTDYGY